jgi:hypothetical protein
MCSSITARKELWQEGSPMSSTDQYDWWCSSSHMEMQPFFCTLHYGCPHQRRFMVNCDCRWIGNDRLTYDVLMKAFLWLLGIGFKQGISWLNVDLLKKPRRLSLHCNYVSYPSSLS